jgi:hypothetical protein
MIHNMPRIVALRRGFWVIIGYCNDSVDIQAVSEIRDGDAQCKAQSLFRQQTSLVTTAGDTLIYDGLLSTMPITNGIPRDVEDYFQVSAFEKIIDHDSWERLDHRVERNMDTIFVLLSEKGVKAIFYAGMDRWALPDYCRQDCARRARVGQPWLRTSTRLGFDSASIQARCHSHQGATCLFQIKLINKCIQISKTY